MGENDNAKLAFISDSVMESCIPPYDLARLGLTMRRLRWTTSRAPVRLRLTGFRDGSLLGLVVAINERLARIRLRARLRRDRLLAPPAFGLVDSAGSFVSIRSFLPLPLEVVYSMGVKSILLFGKWKKRRFRCSFIAHWT